MPGRPWKSSKERREILKEIIRKNPKISQTKILFEYLKKYDGATTEIKTRQDFKDMNYQERLIILNKIRYHLDKMVKSGEINSEEGDKNRIIYWV